MRDTRARHAAVAKGRSHDYAVHRRHRATGYSLAHAYWLAKASGLAYQDTAVIEKQARAWGFDRVRHHQTHFSPPFPPQDTQAYTAASDHMIILAFRGTPPCPGPSGTGYVHHGFAEALESICPQVKDTLAEFRTNGQSVWFTGHSLGGALAMLAGARMYLEEPRLAADGVYTYGQPRTCDRLLAAAYNKGYSNRMCRFRYGGGCSPRIEETDLGAAERLAPRQARTSGTCSAAAATYPASGTAPSTPG